MCDPLRETISIITIYEILKLSADPSWKRKKFNKGFINVTCTLFINCPQYLTENIIQVIIKVSENLNQLIFCLYILVFGIYVFESAFCGVQAMHVGFNEVVTRTDVYVSKTNKIRIEYFDSSFLLQL